MRKKEREEIIDPTVVFDSESFMVINKPAGWIVNEATTTKDQPVIQSWLARYFSFPVFVNPECRNGIVHRLDKETSGCLIVAKTEEAFYKLQKEFKDRVVKKKYIALVHHKLEYNEGTVEAEVGRLPWNRKRFGVLAGGRGSKTRYRLVTYYKVGNEFYSLVEFFPETGRTHQIRIHARYLGNAIVSDTFYAGRKTARKDRQWCPRLFLHAAQITFLDPGTAEEVSVEAPLPPDLQSALDCLI